MSDNAQHRADHSAVADGDAPRPLIITRDFRAPRERVWRAWTQPDAIIRWHGPNSILPPKFARMSVWEERGAPASSQTIREDVVLWQSGQYLVVTPPERLEFTFAWETPGHEDGPGVQTHVIVRLEELANGSTRMHFSQTGFLSMKSASQSFRWLERHLRSIGGISSRSRTPVSPELSPAETSCADQFISETEVPMGKVRVRGFASVHRRLRRRPGPEPGASARQRRQGIAQLVLPDPDLSIDDRARRRDR